MLHGVVGWNFQPGNININLYMDFTGGKKQLDNISQQNSKNTTTTNKNFICRAQDLANDRAS